VNFPINMVQPGLFDTSGGPMTINGAITGAAANALTHQGEGGPLILASTANSFTGPINARTGTVSLTGILNSNAIHNIGDTAGANGFLNVDGGTLITTNNGAPALRVANNPQASGALTLNSGVLTIGGELWLGASTACYGAYIQNGGVATIGSWLAMGRGTS